MANQQAERPGPRWYRAGERRVFVARDALQWFVRRDGPELVFEWATRRYCVEVSPGSLRSATPDDLQSLLEDAMELDSRAHHAPANAMPPERKRTQASRMTTEALESALARSSSAEVRRLLKAELAGRMQEADLASACPRCSRQLSPGAVSCAVCQWALSTAEFTDAAPESLFPDDLPDT